MKILLGEIAPFFVILIMLGVTAIVSSLIVIIEKNKTKNLYTIKQKASLKNANIKLVTSYCSPAEMHFLEQLHKALPKDFIAFPYVSLEKILEPDGDNKVDFNIASSKIVDVCIFLQKTMEPVLAIDLYTSNPLSQTLKKIDEDVIGMLKKVNLPLIQIKLQETYDIDILKSDLLNAMNPIVFAKIKK